MGFIAGFLLMFMSEADAFHIVDMLLCDYGLSGLFQPGLPALPLRFYQLDQLLQLHLPDLRTHFAKEQVSFSMFASPWFLTLYSCSTLPYAVLGHVWDMFFMDGTKMVFRVAIALLKIARAELLRMSFERLVLRLKTLPGDVSGPTLIATAMAIKITNKQLLALEVEYRSTRHLGTED